MCALFALITAASHFSKCPRLGKHILPPMLALGAMQAFEALWAASGGKPPPEQQLLEHSDQLLCCAAACLYHNKLVPERWGGSHRGGRGMRGGGGIGLRFWRDQSAV